MAINVENLGTYVDEQRLPLIRKAVIGARSAYHFYLMTGVKGATKLNILETNAEFGDGSDCGWNEAGTSTLTQRTLEPAAIKVNMSFCDKKLLKTWMNYDVRVAAGQKNLPFEEDFMSGVGESINAKLERAIWQGDKESGDGNLNKFNGIIKIASESSLADTVTFEDGWTKTRVVNEVYAKIPSAAYSKGEVVMYVGEDFYRTYIQELVANGNLVITNTLNDVAMPESILIPATNVRIIGVGGLNGTDKVFASYKDNFVYGVDLTGDEEKFDMWYSQDNREYRLAVEFIAGVQIAQPEMVVRAEKQ
jgi:hypothetical protein